MYTVYIYIHLYIFIYIHCWEGVVRPSIVKKRRTGTRQSGHFLAPRLGMHPPEKNGSLQGPVK